MKWDTGGETDKRQSRKMSGYSTKQPELYCWKCGSFCVGMSANFFFLVVEGIYVVLPGWPSQLTRTLHHLKKWYCRVGSEVSQTRVYSWENTSWFVWEFIYFIKRRPYTMHWTSDLCTCSYFNVVWCLACWVKARLIAIPESLPLGATSTIEIQPPCS